MALESGTYISDLNPSNPVGATDKVSTLDDHVRLIKSTLQNTFPNIDGAVTATEDELNHLDGVTGTTGTGKLVLDDAPTIADLTVSGTEFEVNADDIDFNGDADISGNLTVGGTITGNGSGLSSLNASNLSSGTVPDARLSSNVPLKDAPNTFTDRITFTSTSSGSAGSSIVLQSASPGITLVETDAAADEKAWAIARPINGRLVFFTATDAQIGSVGGTFMAVERSGTTVTEVELNATTLDFNGDADISGTLEVGGAVRAGTAATSTSATLAAGQIHHRSANTTVPSMNAGQWVAVQNTSTSSITLSQGSGVTLELGGTTTTGNRTLLPKGFAFIYFRANGIGVVHGSGVT